MDPTSKDSAPAEMEAFIGLLSEHDQALTGYVMSLVPSRSDAQDILQETKVALWRSFVSFEPGSNFGAWARRAALNRILDFRKRKGRENKRLWFTDECYELLASDYEISTGHREDQLEHLKACISKLQPSHREILVLRYFRERSVEDVAGRIERSVEATYRALSRIRLTLRKCLSHSAS